MFILLSGVVGFTAPHPSPLLSRTIKRTPDRSQDDINGTPAKKMRASPVTPELNGAAMAAVTPTRSSRRIAAMSPALESEKKKLKR